MARFIENIWSLFFFCLAAISCLALTCSATVYMVGDSAGWDISADLPAWVAGKKFVVGDILSFQYNSYHTVNEVTKPGYDNCTTSNAITTGQGGNTTIPLSTPGDKFFICGLLSHCLGGMKLRVNVDGGQQSASPAAAPQRQTTPTSRADDPFPPGTSGGSSSTFKRVSSGASSFAVVLGAGFIVLGAIV
ncbi:hypothetical protein QJS10_CPB20g01371 [Acorus calamus]|uniref:Phytocyanin domain-containing protein n=1 Tax=Acorus calamus TaxID=4465 RepID=A0AAV9C9Q8_ACOCL|nr:hypothetical protein QJS10_CPB20g01371 [Acorus calamus]